MKITIKAQFNKQTKDSKKVVVQFQVTDNHDMHFALNELTGKIVFLRLDGSDVQQKAAFNKTSMDANKTVLDFEFKGDSNAYREFEFYKLAGKSVTLEIASAQTTLDDFSQGSIFDKQEEDEPEEEKDENQATAEFEELD